MSHCLSLLAASIRSLSVFFCLWGDKIQKVASLLEGFSTWDWVFWALQFRDAGLHIPYSQLLSSVIEYQSAPVFELLLEIVLVYGLHVNIFGSVSVVILLLMWTYILSSTLGEEEIHGVGLRLFSFFSIYVLWSSRLFLKVLQSGRKHFFLSPKILQKNPQIWAGFTLTNLNMVLKDLVDIFTLHRISLKYLAAFQMASP